MKVATVTGSLFKHGLRNVFLQDVSLLRVHQKGRVGLAFTIRLTAASIQATCSIRETFPLQMVHICPDAIVDRQAKRRSNVVDLHDVEMLEAILKQQGLLSVQRSIAKGDQFARINSE
jgi:hypothetical protein